jgi:CheY-like chemotaxis protein
VSESLSDRNIPILKSLVVCNEKLSRLSSKELSISATNRSQPPVTPGSTNMTPITSKSLVRTILVVDDFDDTRLLLRTWLERKGFRVVEAEDGMKAVALAQSESPDLIIMDMEMPELDGLKATRRIREVQRLSSVPILAVSAYGADQFRDQAIAAGCDEYVSTPFEPDSLEGLIRSLVGNEH